VDLDLVELCVSLNHVLAKVPAEVTDTEDPPPVWVELTAPLFWLGPAAVMDTWAGWWNYTSEMSLKVGCSGHSAMVGRIWVVDMWVDCWRGGLLVDYCGGPSSGCRRWLILLDGIVRVVFKLKTRWASNIGINS
jgi:hypothetical protein